MNHVSYYLLIFSREQCDAHQFLMFFLHCRWKISVFDSCSSWNQGVIQADPSLSACCIIHEVQWFRCCLCWRALWLIGAKAKDKPLATDKPSGRVILSHSHRQSNLLWYLGCLHHHPWYGNSHSLLSKFKDESQKLLSMRSQQETHPKQRLFDLMSFISTIPPLVCSIKHTYYGVCWLLCTPHVDSYLYPWASPQYGKVGTFLGLWSACFDGCTDGGASTSLCGLTLACARGGFVALSSGLIDKKDDNDCKQYQILYSGVWCLVVRNSAKEQGILCIQELKLNGR